MIREVSKEDKTGIASIYNYYVAHTPVTFEEEPVSPAQFAQRIQAVLDNGLPWLVSTENQAITGYAYATPFKPRSAYRFSVESTIYIAPHSQGKGLGTALYEALLQKLHQAGIRNVIGCITLPNPASVALHEKINMQKVGYFPAVGFKFGQWLDVGFWQVQLSPESD
ncbi:MAG: N-acetyltransferase family protein [Pseudomonadota bacterium]|nr:N-acetyltransferase family protein [Pseudomonadota bacterium]